MIRGGIREDFDVWEECGSCGGDNKVEDMALCVSGGVYMLS